MDNTKGFLSYVHEDDEAESGRIRQLASDITKQYSMITGEKITIFVDKEGLDWGDDWQHGVDTSIATTAYFVAVITPRYFASVECRRELNLFAQQAKELGVQELIMPILYVDVPDLHKDHSGDDLMELVKTYQWHDWTDLRFAATHSPEYRRNVAKLAETLANTNKKLDEDSSIAANPEKPTPSTKQIKPTLNPDLNDDDEDAPGSLDQISNLEDLIPKWVETINELSGGINEVNDIFTTGSAEVEKLSNKQTSLQSRLKFFKDLSRKLLPVSEKINNAGSKFNSQLYEVDLGVRAIAQLKKSQGIVDVNDFGTQVNELDSSLGASLSSLEGMLEQMQPLETMSRDLRKPLKNIRKGLTYIIEGKQVIEEWVSLFEAIDKKA